MKSFATQRQKRGGEDVAKVYYGSPSKKKAVVNFVKVLQMNPYTLGAYFIKEDGASAYYWPLITGLDKNESWCKDLEIRMTVRRRVVGGKPTEVMKVKTSTRYINWHMFLRFWKKMRLRIAKRLLKSGDGNLPMLWPYTSPTSIERKFKKIQPMYSQPRSLFATM